MCNKSDTFAKLNASFKDCILYNSIYVTFLEIQNCSSGEEIGDYQGLREGGGVKVKHNTR
jgi:hypothetical protein